MQMWLRLYHGKKCLQGHFFYAIIIRLIVYSAENTYMDCRNGAEIRGSPVR